MFTKHNTVIWLTFVVFIALQLWLITTHQLFGDEAFYWLEGQHLSWSYSDLPGWTAWMTRLGTTIFGNSYFAVRSISYLGFLSIFWAIWLIDRRLTRSTQCRQINLLLVFALPLLMIIAVMALPDIWLVVFVMWITYFLIDVIATNNPKTATRNWVIIGILIACSINVHVRMWIWLFVAAIVFLIYFHAEKNILKPALFISLPIAVCGMLPILLFNYQHDFVLFAFQFGYRHPWQFQIQNLSFVAAQLLVVTPLVLFLWFNNITKIKQYSSEQPVVAWLLLTALLHWLLYVIMSLFADGLRMTLHWAMISYLPVLSITGLLTTRLGLLKWSVISGGLLSLALLLFFSVKPNPQSNLQARILDNSSGWQELSLVVKRIQIQQSIDNIITDYFMTAATLAFELDRADSIKVLPHPKNIKHGRQKQLQIMGMLLDNPSSYDQQALLVVEDSTLKLQDKGKYYLTLCSYFKQLQFLETVNISNTNKQFHLFGINKTDSSICDIPPLFYIKHQSLTKHIKVSGWAILHITGIKAITVVSGSNSIVVQTLHLNNIGITQQFPEINDPNWANNGFEISIPTSQIINNQFRIKAIGNDDKEYLSPIYFLN